MNKYFYSFPACFGILGYTLILSYSFPENPSYAMDEDPPNLSEEISPVRKNEVLITEEEEVSIAFSPREGKSIYKLAASLEEFMEIYHVSLEKILMIAGMTEAEMKGAIEECGWENIEAYVIRENLKIKK